VTTGQTVLALLQCVPAAPGHTWLWCVVCTCTRCTDHMHGKKCALHPPTQPHPHPHPHNARRSTLAHRQLPFAQLADAAKAALSALRARRLLSLRASSPAAGAAACWQLTPLGTAVVASALTPDTGARVLVCVCAAVWHPCVCMCVRSCWWTAAAGVAGGP
jgi:hypothetical protein